VIARMERGARRLASGCLVLAGLLGATGARAAECNPAKPGSWNDGQLEATFDAGFSELERARNATTESAGAEHAKLAEKHFRAVEERLPCMPPNVVALAEALQLQGRYLDAREQYERVLGSRVTLSGTEYWQEAIEAAEQGATELAPRIPEIFIRQLKSDCPAASVTLTPTRQRGPPARRLELHVWYPIDPGEYLVTATGGQCPEYRSEVSVEAAERPEVPVQLLLHRTPPKRCLGMPPWVCYVGVGVLAAGTATTAAVLLSKPDEPKPQTYACAQRTTTMLGCSFLQ